MSHKHINLSLIVSICILFLFVTASPTSAANGDRPNQFRQLGAELPSPNQYRTASGAPGPAYWQQQVDYDMAIRLDDAPEALRHGEHRLSQQLP